MNSYFLNSAGILNCDPIFSGSLAWSFYMLSIINCTSPSKISSFLLEFALNKWLACLSTKFKSPTKINISSPLSVSFENATFNKLYTLLNSDEFPSTLELWRIFRSIEYSSLSTVIFKAFTYSGKNIFVLWAYFRVISLIIDSWETCLIIPNDFYWFSITW